MLPSDVPKLPPDPACEGVSFCLEGSSSGLPSPKTVIPVLKYFVSLFCLYLSFVLPHSKEIGLPFWVSVVPCQDSEVVLWKLFHIQTIF